VTFDCAFGMILDSILRPKISSMRLEDALTESMLRRCLLQIFQSPHPLPKLEKESHEQKTLRMGNEGAFAE